MEDCRALKKLREESQAKYEKSSKFNRNKNSNSSRSNQTSEEEVNVMVEQYLTKRLFPKNHVGYKCRPRRSIKWRNPLTKEVRTTVVPDSQSTESTDVTSSTTSSVEMENNNPSTSKSHREMNKTIEEELKEFSEFTISENDKTDDDIVLGDLENLDDIDKQDWKAWQEAQEVLVHSEVDNTKYDNFSLSKLLAGNPLNKKQKLNVSSIVFVRMKVKD